MEFVWKLWGAKILRTAVQALISWIGAETLSRFGVTIDTAQLTAALYVALEGLRNYLKHKVGLKGL